MQNAKNYLVIFLITMLILLGFLLFTQKPTIKEVLKRDTIWQEKIIIKQKPPDTIFADGIIEYRPFFVTDTIKSIDTIFYKTPAFIAKLDTVIKDTFKLRYLFPENKFNLFVNYAPDTTKIKYPEIRTEFERSKYFYEEWWFILTLNVIEDVGIIYLMKD